MRVTDAHRILRSDWRRACRHEVVTRFDCVPCAGALQTSQNVFVKSQLVHPDDAIPEPRAYNDTISAFNRVGGELVECHQWVRACASRLNARDKHCSVLLDRAVVRVMSRGGRVAYRSVLYSTHVLLCRRGRPPCLLHASLSQSEELRQYAAEELPSHLAAITKRELDRTQFRYGLHKMLANIAITVDGFVAYAKVRDR